MKCKGKIKNGFTLMEMLIVVAIIAVLIAIAIPTFAHSLKRARVATCSANCRSLQGFLLSEYLSDGKDALEAAFDAKKDEYTCPENGTISYTIYMGTIYTGCSEHSQMFFDPVKSFQDAIASLSGGILEGNRLDSGAVNGRRTPEIVKYFEDNNISMSSINVNSWALINSRDKNEYFVWSSYEIQKTEYKSVPSIAYNATTGEYIVGVTNVYLKSDKDGKDYSANGEGYYILANNAQNSGFNPGNKQSFTSFNEAVEYYNSLTPKT